jgi:hypothetical protein
MDLKIDGQEIPVRYSRSNRILWVRGLSPGEHTFTVHSPSYVFGPEFGRFRVAADSGAHFFIQSRAYRSTTPKNKARISIKAYRRQLRKQGINVREGVVADEGENRIRAYFSTRP